MRNCDTSIETYTGRYLDYASPRIDQIAIEDIARALSFSCRWAGHCSRYYSVAEHAVRVRDVVRDADLSPDLCLAALHHDSHEAYVGDWPTPLKSILEHSGYRDIVYELDDVIAWKFGFDPILFNDPAVVDADRELLWREAATFKRSGGHGPHWPHHAPVEPLEGAAGWPPEQAEHFFILAHNNDMEALRATR